MGLVAITPAAVLPEIFQRYWDNLLTRANENVKYKPEALFTIRSSAKEEFKLFWDNLQPEEKQVSRDCAAFNIVYIFLISSNCLAI
jgi:hypothetical protein